MTRVLVCGGRDYGGIGELIRVLDAGHRKHPFSVVIHGGASGADSMAGWWAEKTGIPREVYLAEWENVTTPPLKLRARADGTVYNAAAGGIRNQRMLDQGKPDVVVAFPGGRGTADMVARAKAAGVKVVEVPR